MSWRALTRTPRRKRLGDIGSECGLLRTFSEGCPEVFVIQAYTQFSHVWGYRSNNLFNLMRWAEDTSPKVRKSLNLG